LHNRQFFCGSGVSDPSNRSDRAGKISGRIWSGFEKIFFRKISGLDFSQPHL